MRFPSLVLACAALALGCHDEGPDYPIAIEATNDARGTEADIQVWDATAARYVYATTFPTGARSCGVIHEGSDRFLWDWRTTLRVEITVRSRSGPDSNLVLGPFHPATAPAWKVTVREDKTAALTPLDHWPC